MGFIFLWAFFDKTFGLGLSTQASKAWLTGVSPTLGYLKNATHGPLADFFHSLAGNPIVDILFMLGLVGVGVAFFLGIAMRFASIAGSIMMILMYISAFPPVNNPIVDDHIIYALVLLVLGNIKQEETIFAKWFNKSSISKTLPFLK